MMGDFMQVYLLVAVAVLSVGFVLFKVYSRKIQEENFRLLTKLEITLEEKDKLLAENSRLQDLYEVGMQERFLAQQKEALALQKCEAIAEQMKAWEEHKQQSIENAKAAIFDVGNKLSHQLIAEHKRESDLHKEDTQKQYKLTTENLYKDFSKLTEIISSLKEQVSTSQSNTDMVYKALLAPNTVGNLAEITLENILKASN
jgi:DNA anti-recombination protein RmuC